MIDLKTLRQLVKLMSDHDLTELDIEGDNDRVKLRRRGGQPEVQYVTPPPMAAPAQVAASAPAPAGQASAEWPDQPSASPSTEPVAGPSINSPMVGTFYSSPTPDAKPFVSVGDQVEPDTVVCIVEAMKVFNEIKAETSGTIEKVLIENGQPVEFGQPLFQVKPS